jgi:hypothetical protein
MTAMKIARGSTLAGYEKLYIRNKVEHRLFSFISSNWRGEPLRYFKTILPRRIIIGNSAGKGVYENT